MSAHPTPGSAVTLPATPRILVVCTRRLGDVLLCTPLLRSLRRAWPKARIDVVVNAGTEVVLAGNPDVDRVWAARPGLRAALRLLFSILRRYDLALATLSSDRAHLLALAAAPRRVGIVPPDPGRGWKPFLLWRSVDANGHAQHAVVQYLRLADLLDIPRVCDAVPPRPPAGESTPRRAAPYAVVHPAAMFRYKSWTLDGWRDLVTALRARGLDVVLSGGPAPAERALVAQIAQGDDGAALPGVTNLAGQLDFAGLTPLIEQARLFVGPDTSVTHLAAATGVPTIALFGPSNPVAWGPWPHATTNSAASPWQLRAPLQHRGNVWILQGITHCVPCLQEGCERRLDSRADCLDQLPAARVIAVVDQILASATTRSDR